MLHGLRYAVGMIGFAMNREDYVKKALYGSDGTGKRGGFIRQMDYLFSPDGYFTEGAYYQRYAIWYFRHLRPMHRE